MSTGASAIGLGTGTSNIYRPRDKDATAKLMSKLKGGAISKRGF